MNLREALIEERSKPQVTRIVNYVGNDSKRFKELVEIFLEGNYRLTQRAAWPLSYCGQANPKLVLAYTSEFINKLKEQPIHDAVKRNILRIWEEVEIQEEYAGEVFEICYGYLRSMEEPVAVKAFAMTVMMNICRKHPELKDELRMLVEDMMPYGKPAILSRGKRILKELDKLNSR